MVGENSGDGFADSHGRAGNDDHFAGKICGEAHAELLVFRQRQVKDGVQSNDAPGGRD